MENSTATPKAAAAQNVAITPDQLAAAQTMYENAKAIFAYGEEFEEDLKDGLTNAEKFELVMGAPTLINAVSSTIKTARFWKKQPKEARDEMILQVATAAKESPDNVASIVSLTFDYASDMVLTTQKTLDKTKKFIKAVRAAKAAKQPAA